MLTILYASSFLPIKHYNVVKHRTTKLYNVMRESNLLINICDDEEAKKMINYGYRDEMGLILLQVYTFIMIG